MLGLQLLQPWELLLLLLRLQLCPPSSPVATTCSAWQLRQRIPAPHSIHCGWLPPFSLPP